MLLYVAPLLRDQVAVRTLEPRRLSALVLEMSAQAALLPEDAATVVAGIFGVARPEAPENLAALSCGQVQPRRGEPSET